MLTFKDSAVSNYKLNCYYQTFFSVYLQASQKNIKQFIWKCLLCYPNWPDLMMVNDWHCYALNFQLSILKLDIWCFTGWFVWCIWRDIFLNLLKQFMRNLNCLFRFWCLSCRLWSRTWSIFRCDRQILDCFILVVFFCLSFIFISILTRQPVVLKCIHNTICLDTQYV